MSHRPLIMGILNASPDSFSGNSFSSDVAADSAVRMVTEGASVIDVGAQSLRTDRAEITVGEELDRLLPTLRSVREVLPSGVTLSVDTYRTEVARAAVEAGATMINNPSGDVPDDLLDLAIEAGSTLVVTYNRARPKVRLDAADLVDDVVQDCLDVMGPVLARLRERGLPAERILFDPGIDLGKSPAQSIQVLHRMAEIRAGLEVERTLWALSRKDFIGALLQAPPSGRDAGTLAALAAVDFMPGDVVRIHDVAATAAFLTVLTELREPSGEAPTLPPRLRHG